MHMIEYAGFRGDVHHPETSLQKIFLCRLQNKSATRCQSNFWISQLFLINIMARKTSRSTCISIGQDFSHGGSWRDEHLLRIRRDCTELSVPKYPSNLTKPQILDQNSCTTCLIQMKHTQMGFYLVFHKQYTRSHEKSRNTTKYFLKLCILVESMKEKL